MVKLRALDCRPFFDAVREKAEELGAPVSVAVVGPEGNPIALERMDDAGFITADTAIAKAYTMAAFRSMSPRFPDGLVIQKWFQERNPQFLLNVSSLTNGRAAASGGAAPIFHENEMIGAYGISGATSQQDEAMGRHACEKLGWAVRPRDDTTSEEAREHINKLYRSIGLHDRLL